jgi:hypothetical protein
LLHEVPFSPYSAPATNFFWEIFPEIFGFGEEEGGYVEN